MSGERLEFGRMSTSERLREIADRVVDHFPVENGVYMDDADFLRDLARSHSTQPSDKEEHPDRGSEAVGFVVNVELEPGEPTLFERREDAEQYAALFADVRAEEETIMDEGLAANFISEAENDIAAEQGKEDA